MDDSVMSMRKKNRENYLPLITDRTDIGRLGVWHARRNLSWLWQSNWRQTFLWTRDDLWGGGQLGLYDVTRFPSRLKRPDVSSGWFN